MEKGNGDNELQHVQDLFFAGRKTEGKVDEEREKELGRIIKDAREAVERESRELSDPIFKAGVQNTLARIKGVHVESGKKSSSKIEVKQDDETDESGKMNDNPYGLDDEEQDIFDLLTGVRELREGDVVPDAELIKEFEVFRRKEKISEDAIRELAMGHMGLVVSLAHLFKGKGISFMELIQEGYDGANDAAGKFDPDFNVKFVTYATWWIKQSIRRIIVKSTKEIRYPQHVAEKIHRMKWAKNEVRHNVPRRSVADKPTIKELAKVMDVKEEAVYKILTLPTAEKILDAPLNSDESGNKSLHDALADEKALSPDFFIEKKMMDGILEKILTGLKPFEREIIERRFGLNGYGEGQSLGEIGGGKLSRERIRQIEERTLSRLKLRLMRIMDFNGIDRESLP